MNKTQFLVISILFQTFFSFSQNDTILVDFGNIISPFPWNNVTHPDVGLAEGMNNSKGNSTDISIVVFDVFNGINTNGTQTPNPNLGIPVTATGDSFFGNPIEFAGKIEPTGGVEIYELDPDKTYTLDLFSSRDASDNRETQYVIIGEATDTLFLDVASNTDEFVTTQMKPNSDGIIQIIASTGPNNTNNFGFFYLGALKIIYESQDPVGSADLSLISPNGGEFWQVGKTAPIWWESQNIGQINLEYSVNGGNSWAGIATVPAFQKEYEWVVPDMPSKECLIRISGDTLTDVSEDFFEISGNSDTCRIVILGSSTAAGTGPSSPDSTWVNRYRKTIYQRDTRHEVINLARGGYTTYHILPTGTDIPPNISITPDTARNMTKALSFEPFAVIVNMPSNDAANNFSVEQQLDNFKTMATAANDVEVGIWICTTQPRNFANPNQIQIQTETRDSIFAIYGDRAIDFWNGIANSDGHISPEFDSGDGVHLNNAGHRILVERVLEKEIDMLNCSGLINNDEQILFGQNSIKIFPNPFHDYLKIEFESQSSGQIKMTFYDVLGREIYFEETDFNSSGQHQLELELSFLNQMKSQILFGHFEISDGQKKRTKVKKLILAAN